MRHRLDYFHLTWAMCIFSQGSDFVKTYLLFLSYRLRTAPRKIDTNKSLVHTPHACKHSDTYSHTFTHSHTYSYENTHSHTHISLTILTYTCTHACTHKLHMHSNSCKLTLHTVSCTHSCIDSLLHTFTHLHTVSQTRMLLHRSVLKVS